MPIADLHQSSFPAAFAFCLGGSCHCYLEGSECLVMGVVLLVFWLVVAVLIGFVCTVVGENKGIGGIRWFVLSLFIGPLALIAVAAMPDLRTFV